MEPRNSTAVASTNAVTITRPHPRTGEPETLEYRQVPGHGRVWLKAGTGPVVWLQSYGLCPAKPVSELVVGDVLIWNFGHTSSVVGIDRVSPKFVEVTTLVNGQTYTRRMKLDRLVGVSTRKG